MEYPAKVEINYPTNVNRLTAFFRILLAIPIIVVLATLNYYFHIIIFVVLVFILFRKKYPEWLFNFISNLTKFEYRVWAYIFLMQDEYPSIDEEQRVKVTLVKPDAEKDLNNFMPLIKWILAIPHYFVLLLLTLFGLIAYIFAFFAILFTGKYPKSVFNFILMVFNYGIRVSAYSVLLITDKYPPFKLS